jgi:RimJ/RimL family protein N-acetyltransferase
LSFILELRPLHAGDGGALFTCVSNNTAYLSEWLDTPSRLRTVELAEVAAVQRRDGQKPARYGAFSSDELVGSIKVIELPDSPDQVELGIWVSSEFSGRGVGKWMMSTLIALMFREGKTNVVLRHSPKNLASARLILGVGGVPRSGTCLTRATDGSISDCVHDVQAETFSRVAVRGNQLVIN